MSTIPADVCNALQDIAYEVSNAVKTRSNVVAYELKKEEATYSSLLDIARSLINTD